MLALCVNSYQYFNYKHFYLTLFFNVKKRQGNPPSFFLEVPSTKPNGWALVISLLFNFFGGVSGHPRTHIFYNGQYMGYLTTF